MQDRGERGRIGGGGEGEQPPPQQSLDREICWGHGHFSGFTDIFHLWKFGYKTFFLFSFLASPMSGLSLQWNWTDNKLTFWILPNSKTSGRRGQEPVISRWTREPYRLGLNLCSVHNQVWRQIAPLLSKPSFNHIRQKISAAKSNVFFLFGGSGWVWGPAGPG